MYGRNAKEGQVAAWCGGVGKVLWYGVGIIMKVRRPWWNVIGMWVTQ